MSAGPIETVRNEPIAIIGLGCVLPDAPDVKAFWDNILAGRSSIREVPHDRWDPALFYSADKSVPDMTYTKIGGFVTDDNFSGLDYRMPPKTVEQIDPSQRWVLSAARQALKDAGYKTGLKGDEGRDFDRTRTAIILGNAMGGELQKATSRRVYWPEAAAAIRRTAEFKAMPPAQQEAMLKAAEADFKSRLIPVTEDTMPGSLSNVAAGRVANVFDLSGKNFVTDAACASSLAALDAAVQTLQRGEADLVVWGGSDRSMDVSSYVQFSKIGALSPDGSRPFDAGANGFVMGEGCGILLLKRLSDAERDGDKVYAVVRGIGASSDGKGKGITAPNPAGQVKAVLRAYEDAAVDPATLGLVEAHGTSTPVGDPVELQSVQEAFASLQKSPIPPGAIAVGSVKGNIGHLKAGAGAAGLLKATLALHHKVLPPSIGVKTLNPRIEWAKSPFRVQTQAAPWPEAKGHPRRAAVSSFGFGGTNFHVVLEEHVPGRLRTQPHPPMTPIPPMPAPPSVPSVKSVDRQAASLDLPAFSAAMKERAILESEPLVLDGATAAQAAAGLAAARVTYAETGHGPRLRDLLLPATLAGVQGETRVAFNVQALDEVPKKLQQAQKAATDPAQARLAFQQGVFLGRGGAPGKVAFLFPGQGTQYVNMMRDLAAKYEVVRNTFHEADEVLVDELEGVKLTDILWPTPDTPAAREAAEKKLQLTEFTQPAVLAADVAILRLLRQWGVEPDVVAGHSLGEYGALVAAGVLSFADALHAVAARGREMAHVEVPDLGKMASVSGGWKAVSEAIQGLSGYVIPANKNSPSQTVIAGSSAGVDEAVALLSKKGFQAQYLPVSAAFHSDIVAPASKPLRNVLARLDVKAPRVRVLSNVGARPYPDDPEAIRDNLAVQVASPVEWVEIVERMHAEGVRVFVEVGPKLALTSFVRDILKGHPDAVAIGANHPKKGGIVHANELFAFLAAWGLKPKAPGLEDPSVYTAEHRDPAAKFRTVVPIPATEPQSPQNTQKAVSALSAGSVVPPSGRDTRLEALAKMADDLRRLVESERTGAVAAPVPATVAAPASPEAVETEVRRRLAAFGFSLDDIGVAGISVGLPGTRKDLFADDNWDRILRGENLIDTLPETERRKIADKNIQRLVKGAGGAAGFQAVTDISEVIQLAGRRGGFDLGAWGVQKDLIESLDRTFQYAIAAGIEALKDAGIPLQRTYQATSQGTWLPKEWKLPESLRDETGIIFASAFPGYDNLLRDVSRYLADKYAGRSLDELQALYGELIGAVQDPDQKARLQDAFDHEFERLQDVLPGHGAARYEFNRKFLFNVLSMGHSQLAQLIGARGPNTQVNAACASTTQAIAIAEDWIRTGRARRVLVVGADDVTSDAMFEWIGAGFLASGAATTKANVEEAALPFDRRRHGMIVGMGAVGLVIEAVPETEKRGMRPIARLLATKVSNSAFHGSRLDVEHIASEMRALLAAAGVRHGITPGAIADKTVFMSHETYTPARGGSASAEIHALRSAFGPAANRVVVANTKGFTGHPQGAGVEDAIVLKCLQRGKLPPIANFKEPDPELGDLRLSKGGDYPDVRYALRLAAGFGSQVAMTLMELGARESERVADPARYAAWLSQVSGHAGARTEVKDRTLRIVDLGAPKMAAKTVAPTPPVSQIAQIPQIPAPTQSAKSESSATQAGPDVLARLVALVAEKTGYPKDLLDPDLDMEADLGIDTVKQAELFGAIREAYALPPEEGIQIKDYNSLRKVAGYVSARLGGAAAPAPQISQIPQMAAPTESVKSEQSEAPVGSEGVLSRLVDLVAEKTGYPKDLLNPDLDMESDLGIDTVKQAEIFGLLRDSYALPPQEGMQIKDYPTLRKVAGYVASRLGGAAPPPTSVLATESAESGKPTPSAVSMDSAARPTSGGVSTDEALSEVTRMVAAKTGYPTDMLQPDLDMESDLGIDTVKQAELFGEVRSRFGIAPVEGLQIKDYPTLRRVADFVVQYAGAAAPAVTAPTPLAVAQIPQISPVPTSEPAKAQPVATIVRRAPMLRPMRLPGEENALARGPVLVVGDADIPYLDALKEAGFAPSFTLADGETPVGIVALATQPGASVEERCGALFDAAKAHRAALGKGAFVLAVTSQDGAHGLHTVRDASMAALSGLVKALRKELPDAVVKAVDVHPDAPDGPRLAVEELLHGGRRTEVAYGADRTRFVVEVAPAPLPDAAPDVAGKALVVSGGAQGITVEMLAALASQAPKFLLLGRTDLPDEAAQWAALDAAGWKALSEKAADELKAKGEKVTPVALQKALDPKRKAADVWRNLQRLQAAGAQVLYAPVDVTDAATVKEAVAWARGVLGRIDGVVHAAGIEVSKDLASKDRAQFDQVLGIKVQGWSNLMEATRDDSLSVLAAFGSVAGRFGNLGQTDYSAANEWLTKAVKEEAARRQVPTAFTVAWGPWGEVGMATRGSILQVMHASGVTPIPTAEGVREFLRELATPGVRESVVAGELGAIDADGQVVAEAWDPAAEVALLRFRDHPERFRLLESVEAVAPGRRVVATLRLDQARDGFARDHRVDGVPYLPGVFGLEAFAETALLLAPADTVFLGAEDIRFASPLKQLKEAPVTARIEAETSGADSGMTHVRCRLTTQFVGPDGRVHGEPRLHFEGTLRFGPPALPVRDPDVPVVTRDVDRAGIYPPFFHGPSFQVLECASPRGETTVALYRDPTESQFAAGAAEFTAHPMAVEALFQACGLGTLAAENALCLPAGIRRLDLLSPGPLPPEVRLVAHARGRDVQGLRTYDAEALSRDGMVLVRLEGFSMVEIGAAPPLAIRAAPAEAPAIPGADVALPQSDELHFAAVAVTPGAAEEAWFTEGERRTHAAFPAPKRKDEWRAGRLAVKKAVLDTHPSLSPRDVEIRADDGTGRPRLYIQGEESALWLSLTHRDGLAIAALAPSPVGIDLETVETRTRSFLEEAFSVNELKALMDATSPEVEVACMWAAKEAALKRAGVGLKSDLRAHEVRADGGGGAVVEGPTGRFGIRFYDLAGKVLAVTAPHLDPAVRTPAAESLK